MAKINRIKITVLKRFSPSEVFKTSPVTPVDAEAFGACEVFKEKGVTINCCIDGLRPVIFKLERI